MGSRWTHLPYKPWGLLLLLLNLLAPTLHAQDPLHHQLSVQLGPESQTLEIRDRITLGPEHRELLLNGVFEIRTSSVPLTRVPTGDVADFFGINAASLDDELGLARYRVDGPADGGILELAYGGVFDFGLSDAKEEYTRGFRETTGIVGADGVYLAGNGFWIPSFGDGLVTFDLEVDLPEGWHVISQGDGSSRDAGGKARWSSSQAMDEIYLVGGPLERYLDAAGAVETQVYLRSRDDGLAAKYLTTAAQYLEMYRGLLGPYPYGKFAVVENFWETGYGMPSFTLLGPTVIRFPFILHSSFPHEILHNWWGNSVFVDYPSGNWCEGLTAYLADHLVKEQRGQGADYRREALQKYRNYVREGQDFPLSEFRSRHSAATEAVGYGKTLMGFHMLRRRVGDESFVRALQRFYRQHRGRRASFADVRASLEAVSGEDLGPFFEDWVERPGAAALDVTVHRIRREADGFVVSGTLAQTQDGAPLGLDVPVAVATGSGTRVVSVRLDGPSASFEIRTPGRPQLLQVDPEFDTFRLLDPREIPPSIGQIFGEPEILAVLPAEAGEEELASYRELMGAWTSESHAVEVRLDTEIESLPNDRGAWILGRSNRFAGDLFQTDPVRQLAIDGSGVTVAGEEIPAAGHSLVLLRRHPGNLEKAVGWLVVEPGAAFPGMARKLPHYGKYSYLGFVGDEPANIVKGQWAATDSPLRIDLSPKLAREVGQATRPARLELAGRRALAELPPVFSQKSLMEHVTWLAAPERQGRGVGSDGLAASADYIARQFESMGLRPGGDEGTYFQTFTILEGPGGKPYEARNVVAYLPGRDTSDAWRGRSALLTAHYDHLGTGWPDVREAHRGQVHPGADDNASGVAVLLELARNLAAGEAPRRHLVFVAFSAEEAGRLGSRHYVENPRFPLDQVLGVINLDTVGRLGDGKVSVLGTGTADEWQHIFRGASWVTGVESRNIPGSAEGSDQWSFIERGVPGVQIFTQAHEDYHAPGDTADKVDGAGLVKIATFVKEGIAYLGEREDPMTVRIAASGEAPPPPTGASQGRRVRFGSVPDFAYPGPGVKLSGVSAGSPAEKAGLREGDVLLRLDGEEITDLRDFSSKLRALTAGQTVQATVRRGEEELDVEVVLETR